MLQTKPFDVREEWYRSRSAYGLSYVPFNSLSGSIELTFQEECTEDEGGLDWRLHFCDCLIQNGDEYNLLTWWQIARRETLIDLRNRYSQEGQHHADIEQWELAILALRKALIASPNDMFNHALLGKCLFEVAHYDEAIDHFTQALAFLSRDSDPATEQFLRQSLADSLATVGKMSEAALQYELVCRINPDPELLDYLTKHIEKLMLMCGDRIDEAIIIQQVKHRLKPNAAQLHINLCGLLIRKGDLLEAERQGLLAIDVAPNDALAWGNLSGVYWLTQQYANTVTCCENSLNIDPNNSKVVTLYAMSLMATGNVDKAVEHLKEALRLDPQEEMALELKKTLQETGIET